MSSSSNERGVHLHTLCRSSGSVQVNRVEGVVLVVIQITGDPSAERTAPPRSTHVRLGRRLLLLHPARGKESLMKIQQHDDVVVDAAQENVFEGVVLVVIQITGDPCAERTAPPR